jgi:hypothetical protein
MAVPARPERVRPAPSPARGAHGTTAPASGAGAWLALQRSAGNHAVTSAIAARRGGARGTRSVARLPTTWKKHPMLAPIIDGGKERSPLEPIFGETWPRVRELIRIYAQLRDADHAGREETLAILASLIAERGRRRKGPSDEPELSEPDLPAPKDRERLTWLEQLVLQEQAELRAARQPAAVSSAPRERVAPPEERDRATLEKLVALEGALMDLVDAEAAERTALEKLGATLQMELLPLEAELLEALKQLRQDVGDPVRAEAAAKRVHEIREQLRAKGKTLNARFTTECAEPLKKLRQIQEKLKGEAEERRPAWVSLMEQLCGTHLPGAPLPIARLPLRRHDPLPGLYGREPTAEDAVVRGRQLEVIHGHGVWYRTGLLTRGLGTSRMPGLVSLRELVERANAYRSSRGTGQLRLADVEFALVTTHGIPATGEMVERGGGPQLMPLSNRLYWEAKRLMAQWKPGRQTLESFMLAQCQIPDPGQVIPKEKRLKPGEPERKGMYHQRMVWRPARRARDGSLEYIGGEQIYKAYKRIVAGTDEGEPGRFAEILTGAEHADVLFPDMGLSYLKGATVTENLFAEETAKLEGAYRPPGFRLSLWEHFGTTYEADPHIRDDVRDVGAILQIERLSDAIVQRLAEIDIGLRPVRIVWAACRSEQLPRGFNQEMFLEWIREAAEQRRKQRES